MLWAMMDALSIVTLVNNDELYAQLTRSLAGQGAGLSFHFIPIRADDLGWNAATALNHGLQQSVTDWVILAHQDVIFPRSWASQLVTALEGLPLEAAVVGLVGIRPDGSFAGHIRDPHGHSRWPPLPSGVVSVDEHVIVVRRGSELRFDEANPGFHCYGTDICLTARRSGFACVVVDAPVVHLSGGRIDPSFQSAAEWLLNKWGRECRGIIPTCAKIIHRVSPCNLLHVISIRSRRRASENSVRSACTCGRTDLPGPTG